MAQAKIAISLDERMLQQLDGLVAEAIFPSRSQAIQLAVQEKLARMERGRLARKCAKLDPVFEKAMGDSASRVLLTSYHTPTMTRLCSRDQIPKIPGVPELLL